ncbi:BrnA antitoxin family protein [Methylobacter psychrophilus]|uniref:BrnA antitoxin family protein n=1 Tax=Methylobacter psychrophilus TaxID=96941 RepID=UPI0021D4B2ED|nr:BrnA antitoxin family protein [Methylobacter psychrophilus]
MANMLLIILKQAAFPRSKIRITICLDDAIVRAYKAKAGGRGYQTLINEALRRGLEADSVKVAIT